MPLLKFRCMQCGKVFDELVPLSGIKDVKCPACKGETERAYEGKCAGGKSACDGNCGGSCGSCSSCGH
jgi:putative FmdB family regulatory protein